MVAASRAGVVVGILELGLVIAVLFFSGRQQAGMRWILAGMVTCAIGFGWMLGGDFLQTRFRKGMQDPSLSGRTQIYAGARRIAGDFPLFGTGAESFMAISGLYRDKPSADWPAYVHNDWLETRVTFGWVGFALVLAMLGLVPVLHFREGVLPAGPELRAVVAIALGGMLLHARFDFPFQILSLHSAFLVVAAVATVLSPRPAPRAKPPGSGSHGHD
jgi:O-antigen ligase